MKRVHALSFRELLAEGGLDQEPQGAVHRAKYDFAVAYPDPDSLPLDGLVESLREAVQAEGRDLAVYPHPDGYPPLRELVAAKLARDRTMRVSGDDIILADGSSQPIYMAVEALIDPGDVAITEQFVYSGTLRTLRRFQADVRGVPCDEEGMLPGALESTIRAAADEGKRPKLIYTIPTFQNPMGWTMTLERRRALLRLSQRYAVPVLEDDCYVDLRYEGEPVASIHSLDDGGHVIYVGSFSKIIAPGMRLGYITAPPEVLHRARVIKSGAGVNQFAALAVHRYATAHLTQHIGEINTVQVVKRDAMLAALAENLGPVATWSRPDGGLFIWLRMPENADLVAAHRAAMKADVGYHPGPLFAPDGVSGKNHARLCFGYNNPQDIHEGVARLAGVFEKLGFLEP